MGFELKARGAMLGAMLALAGCGGSGGSSAGHTLSLSGGAGTAGNGGKGGALIAVSVAGITASKSGGLPSLPSWHETTPDLGSNPLTISYDASMTLASSTVVGDDGTTPATGLWVKKGATLTLSPLSSSTGVSLVLAEGLRVDGTIVLAPISGSATASSLQVQARSASIHGAIRAIGLDGGAGEDGGAGGDVVISATDAAVVTGSILTTGGAGDNGGNAGLIKLTASGLTWAAGATPGVIAVTGLTDASGGAGRNGAGGSANQNLLQGDYQGTGACDAVNTGTMRARGGDGTTGGGPGGIVYVVACGVGTAATIGTVDVSGGAATVSGDGGPATIIAVASGDSKVLIGGTVLGKGGSATAGLGGHGATLTPYDQHNGIATSPTHGTVLAAEIDLSGGDGAVGGAGGAISLQPLGAGGDDAGVVFAGYDGIVVTGGSGTTAGGTGGVAELVAYEYYDAALDGNVLGAAANEVPIDVSGGDASAGKGGAGGQAAVAAIVQNNSYTLLHPEATLTDSLGEIRARGGNGTTGGGAGGMVQLVGEFALSSRARIDLSGGAGGVDGGPGGSALVGAKRAAATISGTIRVAGGDAGTGIGGAAGGVLAQAVTASLGAVEGDGGAATIGTGGKGGAVALTSSTPPSAVTGTLSLRGGAGATAGAEGQLLLDGTTTPLTDGQYKP